MVLFSVREFSGGRYIATSMDCCASERKKLISIASLNHAVKEVRKTHFQQTQYPVPNSAHTFPKPQSQPAINHASCPFELRRARQNRSHTCQFLHPILVCQLTIVLDRNIRSLGNGDLTFSQIERKLDLDARITLLAKHLFVGRSGH